MEAANQSSVLKLLNEARDEKGRSAVTLAVLARATVVCPGYMHLRYTITSIMATFPMYYIGTRARTASGYEQNVQSDSHGTVYVCLGQPILQLG